MSEYVDWLMRRSLWSHAEVARKMLGIPGSRLLLPFPVIDDCENDCRGQRDRRQNRVAVGECMQLTCAARIVRTVDEKADERAGYHRADGLQCAPTVASIPREETPDAPIASGVVVANVVRVQRGCDQNQVERCLAENKAV